MFWDTSALPTGTMGSIVRLVFRVYSGVYSGLSASVIARAQMGQSVLSGGGQGAGVCFQVSPPFVVLQMVCGPETHRPICGVWKPSQPFPWGRSGRWRRCPSGCRRRCFG